MPPPHNWWLRLRLMHTPFFPSFFSLHRRLPCENKSSVPAAALLHSHCAKIPMATDMCNNLPSLTSPSPTHPRHLSSPCNSGEQNRWRLPRWFTKVDAQKGNKISFIIICHLKDSLLVRQVAIGNCEDTDYKEQQAGRQEVGGGYLLWQGEMVSVLGVTAVHYLSVFRSVVHYQRSNCSLSFSSLCTSKNCLKCDKVTANGSRRLAGKNKRRKWDILCNKSTDNRF